MTHYQTSTFNWDTVFAIPITEVNRAIKEQKSSPENFQFQNDYSDYEGEFGDWQITSGGDGNNIRMNIPIRNFKTLLKDFIPGEFGFESAELTIQVKLNYLPHHASDTTGPEQLYQLKIRSTSSDSFDPAVVGISLNKVEGMFGYNPSFEELLMVIFKVQMVDWLNPNLGYFSHIFNVVNLNLYIDNSAEWAWCTPSYVDYAYTDIEGNLDKSLLGVLCMTGGRQGGVNQQQLLDPRAIPPSSNAAFLIAEERFLKDVLWPTLPEKFIYSSMDDYEVVNNSGENGNYQYILQLKKDKSIRLDDIQDSGSTYTPFMKELRLGLVGDEMWLKTYTETPLNAHAKATCRTKNTYNLVLTKNGNGEQTITYKEVKEPIVDTDIIQEGGGSLYPWIILALEVIGLAILTIMTSGATLLISAIIVSILFGTLALLPQIIDVLTPVNSPSIDKMLLKSIGHIKWNASDIFELDYAALAGPLQLGGRLLSTNAS
ncbi:TULIP family P47-like protein [Peribacillus muralis]|uniref:TULIP family P47-like protein n=1 Tax=Peribacillus muralis TaxID=264697 RepID=UPI003D03E835